ncbi:heat shock protein 33 [Spiroplasma sp. TIUS-1]|uniref:Hsp33 family molecular chaperone HslO n=1 Tax=Spiroplasma sp. TIUS-1 TaxID=216963 RepID=UPI00139895CC|nr:Hsp33 family molecular chaperone HslO [Spiroplasma sp. TIUS-1]QHX35569.1 heat shock protein 33 [Spiroplasma sp. TIUS-1]
MSITLRAVNNDLNIAIAIVDITDTLQENIDLQSTNFLTSTMLGKFICTSILTNLNNKDSQLETRFQLTTDGLLEQLSVDIYDNHYRGKVKNILLDPSSLDLKKDIYDQMLGTEGQIAQYKIREGLILSESAIEISGSDIDTNAMIFTKKSEQINNIIATTTIINEDNKVIRSCGIMIHMLPGFTNENVTFLETKIGNTRYMKEVLAKTMNYNNLVEDIAPGSKILRVSDDLKYKCKCSYDKSLSFIELLQPSDIQEIIDNKEEPEIVCEFCGKKYRISLSDINI